MIFFCENMESESRIRRANRGLQRTRETSDLLPAPQGPLLMMNDQEGGIVLACVAPRSSRRRGSA